MYPTFNANLSSLCWHSLKCSAVGAEIEVRAGMRRSSNQNLHFWIGGSSVLFFLLDIGCQQFL